MGLDIIRSLINGEGISIDIVLSFLVRIFVIFCILPFHEFAHAYASQRLGDDTARLKGRLTVAPMAHIDLLGALMILLVGIGWAKPVPVNMHNLKMKNKKLGMGIVALAGPFANIVMALIFLFISNIIAVSGQASGALYADDGMRIWGAIMTFALYAAQINVSLAVFNLIPVPPLDGSRILTMLLPDRYYYKIMRYERYIAYGFMALILFGVLDLPINALSGILMRGLQKIAWFPFGFFA